MNVRRLFSVSRKTFFNPRAWFNFDTIKAYNAVLWDILSGLFRPIAPGREETFAQAVHRLKLTENDLVQRQRFYLSLALFFFVIGALLFVFGFYLLLHHSTFHGWLIAMAASAFGLAQAFRYHFWYFQIKRRKLGCTFNEWRRGVLHQDKEMPK